MSKLCVSTIFYRQENSFYVSDETGVGTVALLRRFAAVFRGKNRPVFDDGAGASAAASCCQAGKLIRFVNVRAEARVKLLSSGAVLTFPR